MGDAIMVLPIIILETLTAREQDVLKPVVDRYTNRGIGKKLDITEDAVKKHMQEHSG